MGDGFCVYAEKLYGAYTRWCDDSRVEPISATAFGLRLGQEFNKQHKERGAQYQGIGLGDDSGPDRD
jgi:phage/plasmid-associated DNA primase